MGVGKHMAGRGDLLESVLSTGPEDSALVRIIAALSRCSEQSLLPPCCVSGFAQVLANTQGCC